MYKVNCLSCEISYICTLTHNSRWMLQLLRLLSSFKSWIRYCKFFWDSFFKSSHRGGILKFNVKIEIMAEVSPYRLSKCCRGYIPFIYWHLAKSNRYFVSFLKYPSLDVKRTAWDDGVTDNEKVQTIYVVTDITVCMKSLTMNHHSVSLLSMTSKWDNL